jgi:RNA polymerase sigma factor (sigma-70 family)
MSDDQMVADFVSLGDGSAFEGLVRRYGPMVFRVCRDVLGDPQDAEDAFQATFVVLLRQAGSIRDRASIGRWLYEVASRISRRERRRVAKIRSQERQVPAMDWAAPPDFDPAAREWKPILHDEIRRLPAKLRDPIVLCYFEGLTVEAAARRLRCPVGTLKSRLGKGRELLRSRLTRRGLAASTLLLLMFSLTEEVSAAVPDPLLDSTVKAGLSGVDGATVSRRVASMVIEEEAKWRWTRFAASWSLLMVLVFIFGASRMALGRKARPAPANPVAAALSTPFASPALAGASSPTSDLQPAVEGHCQAP